MGSQSYPNEIYCAAQLYVFTSQKEESRYLGLAANQRCKVCRVISFSPLGSQGALFALETITRQ